MSLNTLVNYISNSQITSELIKRISKDNELNIVGSSRYAKSIILDSIAKKEEKNILLICPNVEIAYKWIGYFESINDKAVLYYPPTEHLPYASINKFLFIRCGCSDLSVDITILNSFFSFFINLDKTVS